jgi:predicted DNA-binding transcriptional regulator YafY
MSTMTPDSQLSFILQLLKHLCHSPISREELITKLSLDLDEMGHAGGDVKQKLDRSLKKLRSCGFEIESAPHHPYHLKQSHFPLLLTSKQRGAIATARHLLEQLGFAQEAAELQLLLKSNDEPDIASLEADFSPPVDYSQPQLATILDQLRDRITQQQRFIIDYQGSGGDRRHYDLDHCELRLHQGVLYLFAIVPTPPQWTLPKHRPTQFFDRNQPFRVDRILQVFPSSGDSWTYSSFGTLTIRYQLQGPLGTYQPRRPQETVIERHPDRKIVIIEAEEDYVFWFIQRIMRYREHCQILDPDWLRNQHQQTIQKMLDNYKTSS